MKKIYMKLFIALFLIAFISSAATPIENKSLQMKKQPEIQQVKPKKPLKIKVKRLAEGNYTWELSGEDVDEIVKADKRLKKLLGSD